MRRNSDFDGYRCIYVFGAFISPPASIMLKNAAVAIGDIVQMLGPSQSRCQAATRCRCPGSLEFAFILGTELVGTGALYKN